MKKFSKLHVHVLSFTELEDWSIRGFFCDFVADSSGVAAPLGSAFDFELGFDFDDSSGWTSRRR